MTHLDYLTTRVLGDLLTNFLPAETVNTVKVLIYTIQELTFLEVGSHFCFRILI